MTGRDGKRKRPNRKERIALRAAEIAVSIKQYGRRSQKGAEPNDRKYDKEVERRVRRMDPVTLDRLMRDDEE